MKGVALRFRSAISALFSFSALPVALSSRRDLRRLAGGSSKPAGGRGSEGGMVIVLWLARWLYLDLFLHDQIVAFDH